MNSTSDKGGIWGFTLQVDLPVKVHGRSTSSSEADQLDEAFRTLLLPGQFSSDLSSVEIFISRDAATQFAATASGSFLFNIQGFVQARQQVRATMLYRWLKHATWTRIKSRRLDEDPAYKALMGDNNSKRVQVHGEPKNKLGGRPRKVNTVKSD